MPWRHGTVSINVSEIYNDLRLFTSSAGKMAYSPYRLQRLKYK
jgi:hypothetical protein